jgi:hypothetical protein
MLVYFLAGFFKNLTLCMTKLRLVLSFPDFTDISIVQESSRRPAFTLNICADVKRISEYNVGAFEDLDMFWNALVGSKI